MNDPILTNILCWIGILLALVAGLWPLINKQLLKHKAPAAAATVVEDPLPADYLPPQISADDEKAAQGAAVALSALSYAARVRRLHDLIVANMELLLEVNQLRTEKGIPPRPSFKAPGQK